MIKSIARKIGSSVAKLGRKGVNTASTVASNVSQNGVKNTVKSGANAVSTSAKGIGNKIKNVKNGFVDNVLLANDSKRVGPLNVSTRGGAINELALHLRAAQDMAIGTWNFATNGIGEHHIGQLLRRSNDSLIGYKTTGLGTAVAMTGAFAMGVPSAVEEYNTSRQGQFAGTYQMGAIPGLVPQGHAYANNAGATGDLVFALNNNR